MKKLKNIFWILFILTSFSFAQTEPINISQNNDSLKMSPGKTLINNIAVKKEDHEKYKELYKKHFDKELDGTIKIDRD